MTWIRRRIDRVRYLWRVALEENADPHKFARAVTVGTVVSALPVPPAFGLRSFAALGGAWLTRCSKLTAWLASHVVVLPVWVPLAIWQVRIGSAVLGRAPPAWGKTASENLEVARHALLAWWIGGVLVAPFFGVLAYGIAFSIARRYQERKARRRAAQPPDEPTSAPAPQASTPSGAE